MIAKTPPNCTELILRSRTTGSPARTRFWNFVSLLCGHLKKLSSLQNVRGELIAINATSIQAYCVPGSPGHWRGPMTKKDDLVVIVNLVPGNATSAGSIGSQGPEFSKIFGCLLVEPNARAYSSMNHRM